MQIHQLLNEIQEYRSNLPTQHNPKWNELLDQLGNPQNQYRVIHVAGTNGKGSVCAYLKQILINKGIKVGVFTSPHLFSINERFAINNDYISDRELCDLYEHVTKLVNVQLTFFEWCTLLAFIYFKEQGVQWAVIETGLGGRLDATNSVKSDLSVITNISLDHQNILGGTLNQIAKEKGG